MTLSYENRGQKKTDKIDKVSVDKRHVPDVKNKCDDQNKSKSSESRMIDVAERKKPWKIAGHRTNEPDLKLVEKHRGETTSEGVQDSMRHASVLSECKNRFRKRLDESKNKFLEHERVARTTPKMETMISRRENGENFIRRKDTNFARLGKHSQNHNESKETISEGGGRSGNKKFALAKRSFASLKTEYKDVTKSPNDERQEEGFYEEEVILEVTRSDQMTDETDTQELEPSKLPLTSSRSEIMAEAESFSLLLQNCIKAVDSSVSFDASKTMGLTIETTLDEETFSDQENEAFQTTCDPYKTDINYSQNKYRVKDTSRIADEDFRTDEDVNFELKETLEVPNILLSSPNEVTECLSVTVKKAKKLDLNRVSTSNVSLLASSETLHKLKSFHEKNVSNLTKLKQLSSKTSFSSWTADKSKKSLLNSCPTQSSKSLKIETSKGEISGIAKAHSMHNPPNSFKQEKPRTQSHGHSVKTKKGSQPSSQKSGRSFGLGSSGLQEDKPPLEKKQTLKSVTPLENECQDLLTIEWLGDQPDEAESGSEVSDSKEVLLDLIGILDGDSSFKASEVDPGDNLIQSNSEKPSEVSVQNLLPEKVSKTTDPENRIEEPVNAKMESMEKNSPIVPEPESTSVKCKKLQETKNFNKVGTKAKISHEPNKFFDKSRNDNSKPSKMTQKSDGKSSPQKSFKNLDNLIVRGTHIPIKEKRETVKSDVASEKAKIEITIDLKTSDDFLKIQSTNVLHKVKDVEIHSSKIDVKPESDEQEGETYSLCKIKDEESMVQIDDRSPSKPSETSDTNATSNVAHVKSYKSSCFLKKKSKLKMSATRIKARPKKIKPEPVNRSFLTPSGHFSSVTSFISKNEKDKLDAKIRNNLKKALNHKGFIDDDLSYIFDDAAAANLRRRKSEPNSFKGFVWKQPELTVFKGNKTSVSSVTSSLRHMNTDELEDFRVWEAAPLKMTSCWEMSLYHCKRPWSVLSCSVFKDNRLVNAPGIILENLRSGGTLDLRAPFFYEKERIEGETTNALDVEPSVAQKNIDIKNWLSALNFSSPPSTSSDVISEGNFVSTVSIGSLKNQMTPKRRKLLRAVNYSEEALKRKFEDNRNLNKSNDLMDLVRRKSGGYVTVDRNRHFAVSNNSRQLVMVSQESQTTGVSNQRIPTDPNKEQTNQKTNSHDDPVTPEKDEIEKQQHLKKDDSTRKPESLPQDVIAYAPPKSEVKSRSGVWVGLIKFFKGESEINVWKYLFILSLSVILYHLFDDNFEIVSSALHL